MERYMELPLQTRAGELSGIYPITREVSFAFSSTSPVQQKWGIETLAHNPGALDTTRLDAGAVVFLRDHDFCLQCGKVTAYRLGNRKNFGTAKLFRSPAGDALLRDVMNGRLDISCGYVIDELQLTEETLGQQNNAYIALKWRVHEISSVAAAADPACGIGRELDEQLANQVYACRVASPSGQIMLGERQEIEQEILNEWEIQEELKRRELRDKRIAALYF